MDKNANAQAAGLNGLFPYPPNGCLITTTANSTPKITSSIGIVAGSSMVSSSAVTTEERPSDNSTRRPRSFTQISSAANPVPIAASAIYSTLVP